MVRRLRRAILLPALEMVLIFSTAGCEPMQPLEPDIQPVLEDNHDARWPFWPVLMKIHALTRITIDRSEQAPVLEARIEFDDSEGATSKAYGQILLELTEESGGSSIPSEIWTVDLRDLRANATHFDEVTRTYMIKLRLNPSQQRYRPQLRVQYQGVNGTVLHDRRSVRPYVIDSPVTDDGH